MPKLIILVEEVHTEAEQAKHGEQVKGKEPGMTSRKGNSTDQQPFKQHIMAPETF